VPRIARKTDPWTWLSTHEISQLTGERVEQPYRDIFVRHLQRSARGRDLRPRVDGRNVDAATAKIRHSWRGSPDQARETRTLHLFGPALETLRRQKARASRHAHVFASADGEPHARGYDAQLAKWLDTAGIKRRVRFHDLRHTCASHLVSGT
jgi:integrase